MKVHQFRISVIIPTLNEVENIKRLLPYLKNYGGEHLADLIVADGGSTDGTRGVAKSLEASVVTCSRGRACQMNAGVKQSSGDILYFVHADSIPPKSFAKDVIQSVEDGYIIGGYRFQFDSNNPWLKINSFFTRFNRLMFRGGDQTLFITRSFFEQLGGYREDYRVMEEYDLMTKARKLTSFKLIQKDVLVSARKYDSNSYLKVNIANLIAFKMFQWGYSQERITTTYYKLLRQPTYKYD